MNLETAFRALLGVKEVELSIQHFDDSDGPMVAKVIRDDNESGQKYWC